jgi:hypothetical protein
VDEQLVVAHAVVVAGIEQADPGVQRRVDGGDAFGLVGGTVGAGHRHAAQTDRRHLRTGRPKPSSEQRTPPRYLELQLFRARADRQLADEVREQGVKNALTLLGSEQPR